MDFSKKCLLVLILVVAGCSTSAVKSDTKGSLALLAQRTDRATLEMLMAAGNRATVTLVVHPSRWTETAAALPSLQLASQGWFAEAIAAPDLWTAIERTASGLFEGQAPKTLAGWDMARPIVVALLEPQVNETVLATRAVVPFSSDAELLGLRHRILVPAKDPAAMVVALSEWAARLDLKREATGPDAGVPLFSWPAVDGFVALVAEERRVRVEILTGERRRYPTDAERVAAWRTLVATTPAGDPLPTPAMVYAGNSHDFLVIHVRPWELRDLGSQVSLGKVLGAVENADPSMKAMLIAQGLSEVSTGYLLMSPLGAEMDDLAIGLGVDGGLWLKSVVSLTEAGERVIKAGQASARPTWRPVGPTLIQGWSTIDLNAVLNATVVPPALAALRSLNDLAMEVQQCGGFCFVHLALRNPLGVTKALLSVMPGQPEKMLPRSIAFSVQDLGLTDERMGRMAAVLTFAPGQDTAALKQSLADLGRFGLKTEVVEERRGADTVLRVGINTDPRQAFTAEPVAASPQLLGEIEVDFSQLPVLPHGADGEMLAALRKLGRISSRGALADRALIGEARLVGTSQGSAPAPLVKPGEFAGLSWESPGAKEAGTKGARCLEQVTRDMVKAFQALAMADPGQRTSLLSQAIEEVQPSLDCALAEQETRQDARKTRGTMWLFLASQYLDGWRLEEGRAVLDKACGQGYREACDRLEALAKRPKIELARATVPCGGFAPGAETLVLSALGPPPDLSKVAPKSEPMLAADRSVSYQAMISTLTTLSKQDVKTVNLLVAAAEKGVGTIQVEVTEPDVKAGGLLEKAPVVVKLQKNATVEILGDGAATSFLGKAADKNEAPGVDAESLAKWIGDLGNRLGEFVQVYVDAEPDCAWRDLAIVLSSSACAQRGGERWSQPRKLLVGPVPKLISDRAMLAHGPRSELADLQGKGMLKLLGAVRTSDAVNIGDGEDIASVLGDGSTVGFGGGFGAVGAGQDKKTTGVDVKPGTATVRGSLPKEIIQRLVRSHLPGIRYCYEKDLLQNPNLKGRIVTQFVIDSEGKVDKVTIKSSTLKNKSVEECVLRQIKSFQFPNPKGGGKVIVNYPFDFKAEKTGK